VLGAHQGVFGHKDWSWLRKQLEGASREDLIRLHRLVLKAEKDQATPLHDNATVVVARISVEQKRQLRELAADAGSTSSAVIREAIKLYLKQHTH